MIWIGMNTFYSPLRFPLCKLESRHNGLYSPAPTTQPPAHHFNNSKIRTTAFSPPPPHTHTASSSPSMDHTFVFPILKLEENRTGGLDRWALHLFFSLFPRPSVKTLWWLRDWIHGSVIEGMTKWDFPYIYIFLLFWCWEGGGGGGSVREELFNSKRE